MTYDESAYQSSAYADDQWDVLSVDLQALYNFDGNATDSYGSNDLTATASPTYVAGKLDQAINFNGSTQYCSRASSSAFTGNTFTWTAWLWLADPLPGALVAAIGKWTGDGSDEYGVGYNGSLGKFIFTMQEDGGAQVTQAYDGITPASETWYFVCCRYSSLTMSMDVNLLGVETQAVAADPAVTSSLLYIGSLVSTVFGWPGRVDQVARWNRSITDAEESTLYNAGAGLRFPY